MSNCDRFVFVFRLPWRLNCGDQIRFQPHMHCNYYHVSALFHLEHANPLARLADRFMKLEARVVRSVFPGGNSWCRKSQNTDANSIDLLDNVWLKVWVRSHGVICISRQPWEHRFS